MAGWSISFFFFSSVIILQKGMSDTRAQIKDPEIVTNKMYGCNIDMKVTLSGSLICARALVKKKKSVPDFCPYQRVLY